MRSQKTFETLIGAWRYLSERSARDIIMPAKTMNKQRGTKRHGGYSYRTTSKRANTRSYPNKALLAARTAENKYVDLGQATYTMNTTGSITLLATIPSGVTVTSRVGKKVLLKSLQFRGTVFANAAGLINDVAFMIVYDRRPQAALPAITDILTGTTSSSMANDDNTSRFTILKRSNFCLSGNSGTAGQQTGTTIMDADFFLPILKICNFNALGTGAIDDIDEGALYLVTLGGVAAGTAAASMSGIFRTRFSEH